MAGNDGLDMLKQRLDRKSRTVPPPRNPRPPNGTEAGAKETAMTAATPEVTPAPVEAPRAVAVPISERPQTQPGEPVANLAIRVRLSLDHRLDEVVHALKREGIHTSKAELVELLLWELPPGATLEFRSRLAAFRQNAPRERPL